MSKADKILTKLTIAILIILAIMILITGWMLLFPYKTLDIVNPIPVLNKEIHQGDNLQLLFKYTKYIDEPCIVVRSFNNDIIYTLPIKQSSTPKGNGETIITNVTIPKELPSGDYYLSYTFIYEMNPIRTIKVHAATEEFRVK